jgi:hypothetical protein
MPLNTSGPISLAGSTAGQSIALELGESATGVISLNDSAVRDLGGVASGAIVMPTNFYGASSGPTLTLGSAQGLGEDNISWPVVSYNEQRDKVLLVYGLYGARTYPNNIGLYCKVGTVSSGEFITYGAETTLWNFNSSPAQDIAVVYRPDDNSNSVFWKETTNSGRGLVAAVRINSSGVAAKGASTAFQAYNNEITIFGPNAAFFDPDTEYSSVVYRNFDNSSYGEIQVADVTNSSVLAYNEVVFNSGSTEDASAAYDTNVNKFLVCYTNASNNSRGTAIVGTMSGTVATFGTAVVYSTQSTFNNTVVFDSTNNKMVVIYDAGNDVRARVGTISGTSVSFGTEVIVDTNYITGFSMSASFDPVNGVVIVSWEDRESSPDNGMCVIGTVSGTSISFSGLRVLEGGNITQTSQVYDPDTAKTIISYKDVDATNTQRAKLATVVPA